MFDASDLRGQRIVLGMPPLAPLPSRNRCAPSQNYTKTNFHIIGVEGCGVKGGLEDGWGRVKWVIGYMVK